VREIAKKALLTLKQDFGEQIFETPRFKGALLDVPINAVNSKKIRFLLVLTICELNAYSRLKETDPNIIINELIYEYSIDLNAAEAIVSAILIVLGKKPIATQKETKNIGIQTELAMPNTTTKEEKTIIEKIETTEKKLNHSKNNYSEHKNELNKVIFSPSESGPLLHTLIDFGGLKWRVLRITPSGSLLIISERIIGKMAYHNRRMPITWEESDLRKYLNLNFYNKFEAKDRERIIETKIRTSFNEKYFTAGGSACIDNVFVLSIKEAEIIFKNNLERIAKFKNKPDWWWLRSPGIKSQYTAFINSGGSINYEGEESVYTYTNNSMKNIGYRALGVRPAMFIKI